MSTLYGERDTEALEPHYWNHVSAMTGEQLHSKSAIAAELAFRDAQIAKLQDDIRQMIEKAAAKHRPAYHEQSMKIMALEDHIAELEAICKRIVAKDANEALISTTDIDDLRAALEDAA